MSAIAHRKNAEIPATATQAEDAPVTYAALMLFRYLRRTIIGIARIVAWIAEAFAEARMQRAQIEIEFYHNRYRHSSKNDDDLPMIH